IRIEAGGCVQSGGSGKTWKRYTFPQGSNADRLYHGMVAIPGVTLGMVALESVVGKDLVVSELPFGQIPDKPKFGYLDDKYSDNGYDRHDNGTNNQCLDCDSSFIRVYVKNTSLTSHLSPNRMDLVWKDYDVNGLPINP